ncbi:platelet-activating factor acetylhydrolase IB subunit alpha2-like [Watersipora subatra]|uniref:platelet-activating factor acetylhydrolase IB subunit alpha2-like n=1 Tax=Watersipora subatra TaxID=2589382 RepID=UPI00355B03C8
MSSNSTVCPSIVEDVAGDNRWMFMHQRFVAEAEEKEPDVVLLGDALFSQLHVAEIWNKMFAPLHCLNFSIDGDKTENVLWRCQNGELDNISPQVVVVCAGTDNSSNSSEETYEGILAIVNVIRQKQPQAHIVVVSIPPRGRTHNSLREKIGKINIMLDKGLEKLERTQLLSIDPGLFINPYDGTISHQDMYDYLHFTAAGYEKFCEPILEEIQILLKDFLKSGHLSDDPLS